MLPRLLRETAIGVITGAICLLFGSDLRAEPEDQNNRKLETFETDPSWDGYRNRLLPQSLPIVKQDFGYRRSNFAGGKKPGEIGGRVHRAHPRAHYALEIDPKTLDDRLTASGKIAVTDAGGGSGALIGWFNNESSQGWRTPDSIAFRVDGNGGKYWVFYEYGTSQWGTGGGGAFEGERYQTTATKPFSADGTVHDWKLTYDPQGASGQGSLQLQFDDEKYDIPFAPGHKTKHGAKFNRFGIWNQQTAGDALQLYLDDLIVDGAEYGFDQDPKWTQDGNPVTYGQRVIRPYHDFGFSATNHTGSDPGEIGGIVFRDEQPMYYADKVGPLSLDDELRASGKIVLRSAGADSAVNIGWFGSEMKRTKTTPEYEEPQTDYLGVLIEGPSRVGHFFRPAYSTSDGLHDAPTHEGTERESPVIRPNDEVHEWSFHYDPKGAAGQGQIEVTFDGKTRRLDLHENAREQGASFDRFGVFNTQAGGHHVEIYFDSLQYTH